MTNLNVKFTFYSLFIYVVKLIKNRGPGENIPLKVFKNFSGKPYPSFFGDCHRFADILFKISRLFDE